MWHLMNNGCCSGTCFINPAEVKTPQMSEREKYSSFVLSFNQARACSSSIPGSKSLVIALSMLVLHCGSLYTEDMALLGKRRHLDPLLLSSTVLWWSEKDIILIHSSARCFSFITMWTQRLLQSTAACPTDVPLATERGSQSEPLMTSDPHQRPTERYVESHPGDLI